MNILIIEDEPLAGNRLKRLLTHIEDSVRVLAILSSIADAVKWFQEHPAPDLILMDIQLEDGSSFEIFKEVPITIPTIFTTAYDEFAIEAFKVNSIDYLLKPIKEIELKRALDKFKRIQPELAIGKVKEFIENEITRPRRIVIRYGPHIKALDLSEAAYFYVENKITLLRTFTGNSYPVDYTLDQLATMLDPLQFFRINRQFIISFEGIKEMFTHSKSRVRIVLQPPLDQEIIVSSDRSPYFKEWLKGQVPG